MISSSKGKKFLLDVFFDIVGAFIYSTGLRVFIVPNQVAQGGTTGISIMINYLTGAPIGMMCFLINIPLLMIAYKIIGKRFVLRTVRTSFILSAMVDLFTLFNFPTYKGVQLLAAIFGGVLIGTGLGVAFLRGSTTGGTDIVARLIQRKFEQLPIGRVMLLIDFCILTASVFVFKNLETGLVGVVGIFASSKVIDMLVYGVDKGRIVQVFSPNAEEIAKKIIEEVHRGVSLIRTVGAYTGEERLMLMCATRNSQYPNIKRVIYSIDPNAFIIVSEANEVLGNGFRTIEQQNQK